MTVKKILLLSFSRLGEFVLLGKNVLLMVPKAVAWISGGEEGDGPRAFHAALVLTAARRGALQCVVGCCGPWRSGCVSGKLGWGFLQDLSPSDLGYPQPHTLLCQGNLQHPPNVSLMDGQPTVRLGHADATLAFEHILF